MEINQQNSLELFEEVIQAFGEPFIWRWDEKHQALLTEFSRDKKELCLPKLQQFFPHEWNKKNIKQAPKELKLPLKNLAKLTKEQLLFSKPSNGECPAIMALWWPWGHGGTYSVRLVLLKDNYTLNTPQKKGWWASIKERFTTDYL